MGDGAMSGGGVCRCRKREAWRIRVFRGNHSAFNGYRFTPSDYSLVECCQMFDGCGAMWRTKAAYTAVLPLKPAETRPRADLIAPPIPRPR